MSYTYTDYPHPASRNATYYDRLRSRLAELQDYNEYNDENEYELEHCPDCPLYEGYEHEHEDVDIPRKYAKQYALEQMSPYEREVYRRRQNAATAVQTFSTAGGALVGTALAGPFGGAVGGAGGAVLGEALSPTPGEEWSAGRVGKKALIAALAAGVPAGVFAGAAPLAATIGGAASGYWNSRR